jgi:HD-GYP domain-containing protein (c-di-GMP phosphodiesterase class II)
MVLKIRRYPFYIEITTLVIIIIVSLTTLFLWISHRESKTVALHMADQLFSEINEKILERYENTLESVAVLAESASHMPSMATLPTGNGVSHPGLDLMIRALSFYEYLFSCYIGYNDGSFIQIVAVRDKTKLRRLFSAPIGTFYVLRTISSDAKGETRQYWHFLDKNRHITGRGADLDSDYDPRIRPWYIRAQKEETAFYTQPYIFSSTKVPGVTCAEKLAKGNGVFGADITLDRFSESLIQQKVSDNNLLFLFDRSGRIIAHPTKSPVKVGSKERLSFLTNKESDDPRIRFIIADYIKKPLPMLNRTKEIKIDGSAYLVRSRALKATLKFDQILASIAPVSDFTGYIRRMRERIFFFSYLVLLVALPIALLSSHKISESLEKLAKESEKIQARDFSESKTFDSRIKEIYSLIQAFTLMKRKIRDLIEQQRKLFDDFTKLIAGAIDAKSPYTGGHCARVPEVAKLLAIAADKSTEGPFTDFKMDTKDKRWEFEVAAWLHDCGKITTPEYVADKATKLETIYNRIHEIRMRFEVLLRDAKINAYRKLFAGDTDNAAVKAEFQKKQRQIIADFAFVAECNIGSESMADENIERLKQIAAQTWVRHLDDRIGISDSETKLKNRKPKPILPVIEQVLSDKSEHLIPWPNNSKPALTKKKINERITLNHRPFGFNTTSYENQYNLGELYNLSVRKGTLTPEERFKINEHIIQTIKMLKSLPFPNYLEKVPEFASAHHETMIGTGYPRGVKKEDMSIPARIMAIADIFEALTASDRPYKKPKTLGEALKIMSIMRDNQHIDADLFDLFLNSGVYQKYALDYLPPEQIDIVDISQFLSTSDADLKKKRCPVEIESLKCI